MSNYSGYSSASRMEIARIEKEKKIMENKMAIQDAQMATQAAALAKMQALLEANGLVPAASSVLPPDRAQFPGLASLPGPSGVSTKNSHNHASSVSLREDRAIHTPNRKRRSSQPLGGTSKDTRFSNNMFQALMDDELDFNPVQSRQQAGSQALIRNHVTAQTHPEEQALNTSTQRNPITVSELRGIGSEDSIEPIFAVENVAHMRQEIVVSFEKLNGNQFKGTITPQEAKHEIYKNCLGFVDFSNFDGVRCVYKNGPVAVFKLKSAINVDELLPVQFFEFRRVSTRHGKIHHDVISCKILGLRHQNQAPRNQNLPPTSDRNIVDDGTRKINIEGCEYRIPCDTLVEYLSVYGDITSNITEDLFVDGCDQSSEEGGTNRTGNYSVQIRLNKPIPQLIPILGKRIKINYPGVQKQCTVCFGKHPKKVCKSAKVTWLEYVTRFAELNPEIPVRLIRKSSNLPKSTSIPRMPSPKQVKEIQPSVPLCIHNPNLNVETISNATLDTASWIHKLNKTLDEASTTKMPAMGTQSTVQQGQAPTPQSFLIPADENEHRIMIGRLVSGGLTMSEAQQSIEKRKTAFNKASKEFKKSITKHPKKAGRPSKHANLNTTENVN